MTAGMLTRRRLDCGRWLVPCRRCGPRPMTCIAKETALCTQVESHNGRRREKVPAVKLSGRRRGASAFIERA
jgi:hypothetical protein